MISVIKQHTNCEIIIGVNGVILVTGKSRDDEELAIMAINKIETESHTSGLTDRITQLLKAEKEKREEIKNEPKTKKVD
jgi:exosome complex component RRP4